MEVDSLAPAHLTLFGLPSAVYPELTQARCSSEVDQRGSGRKIPISLEELLRFFDGWRDARAPVKSGNDKLPPLVKTGKF